MNDESGWRPLPKAKKSAGQRAAPNPRLRLSPFGRLARTHALSAAADGAIAVALAGSIFFSIDPSAARGRVALYLVLTIAPFAVVTPLIGPAIDRFKGGRRGVIIGSIVARALIAFFMIGHIDSPLLFPEAFGMLVLQKGYHIAKSAMVPHLVATDDELVEKNSKLALISAISGLCGGGVSALFALLGGPAWSAGLAMVIFLAATAQSFAVPKLDTSEDVAPSDDETAVLRSLPIRLAAVAMGVLRGVVGFITFLLAFELRGGGDGVDVTRQGAGAGVAWAVNRGVDVFGDPQAPAWHFGVVGLAAGAGALIGARFAPVLRQRISEENMLLGALGIALTGAAMASWVGGVIGAVFLAGGVGLAASSGKLAFDSLVQRSAPGANHGRSFATFEARFQLAWVIGAFLPVIIPFAGSLGSRLGYIVVAATTGVTTAVYFVGSRRPIPQMAGPSPSTGPDPTTVMPGTAASTPTTVMAPLEPGQSPEPSDPPVEDLTAVWPNPAPPGGATPPAPPAPSPPVAPLTMDLDASPPPPPPPPPVPPGAETPSWTEQPAAPVVSSVDGVEIDDDVAWRPTTSSDEAG